MRERLLGSLNTEPEDNSVNGEGGRLVGGAARLS